MYIIGWILICVSPFFLSPQEGSFDLLIAPLILNLLVGFGLSFYLLKNKDVERFFIVR